MLLRVMAAKPRSRAICFAIERKSAAGQRARSERHHVHARAGLPEALVIAREHFEIRQQIVRPQHRLARGADACSRARSRRGYLLRHAEQRCHQADQQFQIDVDLLAQPQPDIERHLLIAAAAGVDLVGQRRRLSPSICG